MAKKFAMIRVNNEVVLRNDWIRAQFEAGMKRKEIAAVLGVRYQVVYAATKHMENIAHNSTTTGRNILLTAEDGTIQSRKNIIRDRYLRGESRSEIAKSLSVRYQIVYAATKGIEDWERETVAEAAQENKDIEDWKKEKEEATQEEEKEEVEPVEPAEVVKPKAKRPRKSKKTQK